MHLDDPRRQSSRQNEPCPVVHTSGHLARQTAAPLYKPPTLDAPLGFRSLDPALVACSDSGASGSMTGPGPGTVLDPGGGHVERREASDRRTMAAFGAPLFRLAALLLIGLTTLAWAGGGHSGETAHLRDQAPSLNPLLLFLGSPAKAASAHPTVRGRVYVPAYSTIRVMTGRSRVNLATTLSIHNTSSERPLTVQRVDYHDTEGALVQAFLDQPVILKPFAVVEMFVPAEDVRGGSGANFLVEWAADGPMTEPVVEAVMIGTIGTTSYSFVSQGRRLEAPR